MAGNFCIRTTESIPPIFTSSLWRPSNVQIVLGFFNSFSYSPFYCPITRISFKILHYKLSIDICNDPHSESWVNVVLGSSQIHWLEVVTHFRLKLNIFFRFFSCASTRGPGLKAVISMRFLWFLLLNFFSNKIEKQIVTMDRFIKVLSVCLVFFCIHAHFLFQLIIKSNA